MSNTFKLSESFTWLYNTIYFIRKHFLVIMTLGLVAAFGRVIQLGGFGSISSSTNIVLEVVVEGARIALFLYVLGLASVKNGALRIMRFCTRKDNRKQQWSIALRNLRNQWISMLVNIAGFLLIAWVLNYLIDLVAYKTCLYLTLKKDGILADSSSEWTILLFFKNLSVIPFTLVFETILLLSLTNKLKNPSDVSIN